MIGVDENDFVSQTLQCLAGLGPRIVKLASLPNNNWTGTDNQYLVNVVSSWHGMLSLVESENNAWRGSIVPLGPRATLN